MTRLLHGAEAWPVLRAKQIGRIAKCYMHILRAATSELYRPDKAKNFKSDADFLAEYNLLAVEYYVAQKRLLYAARMERYGKEMLYDILDAEDALRKDSWLAALRGDLLWLTDVAGSDWGTDLQTFRKNWGQATGWKCFVKRACSRHVSQEKIACKIRHRNKKGKTLRPPSTPEHPPGSPNVRSSPHKAKQQ